jgi:PqqD family protein of HPr-rel-A system
MPRTQADPCDAVRSVELEGLTLLYHRPSGMTHVLAPPAPQILEVLREGAASLAELQAQMAARFDLDGGEPELAARLVELEAAGLVRSD